MRRRLDVVEERERERERVKKQQSEFSRGTLASAEVEEEKRVETPATKKWAKGVLTRTTIRSGDEDQEKQDGPGEGRRNTNARWCCVVRRGVYGY